MLSSLTQDSSVTALLLYSAFLTFSSFTIYLLFQTIYNTYFHSLSKYPASSPLASLGPVYDCYQAFLGRRHLTLATAHATKGPVVRYAPNALSFSTASALKTIYSPVANVQKSEFYSVFPAKKGAESTHSAIDKHVHARKRRVLSQAFGDTAVKGYEEHILDNVTNFLARLDNSVTKEWGTPLNMADLCNYLTFDIMGDLCFGKAFGMLEREENRFAIELIGSAAKRHLICGTLPLLHSYHLDTLLFPKIAAGRARYMAYSRTQAAQRTALSTTSKESPERKDFFTHLLAARDPETGQGFSLQELWGESNLLIIAGSDTTSTALTSTFFYLAHNRRTLAKAQEEVRSSFKDINEIVGGKGLNGCVYLRACIDESMRMSPPVPGILPREVCAGGLEVDGHHIPAGTVVGVSAYAIHHNPEYFPSPFTYSPERWIEGDEEETRKRRSAFCPFSVGSRGCIGKGLAYTELMVTLARTLWAFDIQTIVGDCENAGGGMRRAKEVERRKSEEYQLWDCFTSQKIGPILQFRRQKDMPGA